jgi:bacteriorhodopsin
MAHVDISTDASILVQLVVGIVSARGLTYRIPEEHAILMDVLRLETIVQIIELAFYILFLRRLAQISLESMAAARYFDWVITTPLMLFTTSVYLAYEGAMHKQETPPSLNQFIQDHKREIAFISIANLGMLIMGYMGEVHAIDTWTAFVLGSVFFALAFHKMYATFAVHSPNGKRLFYLVFALWSVYGVAFMFPDAAKNHTFNVLDIFAKNFFGVFLYYKVRALRIP